MLNEQLLRLHRHLRIPEEYCSSTRLQVVETPKELVSIGPDIYGRDQSMTPSAAHGWSDMVSMAMRDQIELQAVSAYRSANYQAEVIQRHLDGGDSIQDILARVAAPGYSEHHSGRAIDLTTPGFEAVEEIFEESDAFQWLTENADQFKFRMSYPKNNSLGVIYEPWHWCYHD